MVTFKGNGEPRTRSIVTTLDFGEGELSLDDAFLDVAQHFGLEINLGRHNGKVFN